MNSARSIRVFLSSTFGDMQAERNELVGNVFPKLRRWLAPSGVDIVEIDLRWGISRDDAYSLLVCLEEVDACHPFFLCFLGHQCGSLVSEGAIPPRQKLPPPLRAQHEQLRRFVGRGYTEVEVWRAVLSRETPPEKALFYFRSRAASEARSAEITASLAEAADPGQSVSDWARRQLAEAAARARDPLQSEQAEELRRKVEQKFGPVPAYATPEEFGKMVEADLRAKIGLALSKPDQLCEWRTPAPHWLAQRSRRYFARTSHLSRLSRAVRQGGPAILWGEEGGGRTALLAVWARLAAGRTWEDTPTIVLRSRWPGRAAWVESACRRVGRHYAHKIWISAEALGGHADWRELATWLATELAGIAGNPVAFAAGHEADLAWRLLPALLKRAASFGGLLVIIDGLDHLSNAPRQDLLAWLPAEIPPGVSLLVSLRDSAERRQQAKWRRWRNIELPAASRRERLDILDGLLSYYGKSLKACDGANFGFADVVRVPRHLGFLADWLRRAGYEGEAKERARILGNAASATDLAAVILRATAKEVKESPLLLGFDGEALFVRAMGYLRLARAGMSETSLRDLLGPAGERLLAAAWVPLLDRLKGFLTESAGRYFLQPRMAEAVCAAWPEAASDQLELRQRLAAYFAERLPEPEALEEAPWQWFQAGDGKALLQFMSRPQHLAAWLRLRPLEAPVLWAGLERDNSGDFLQRWLEILTQEALEPSLRIEDAVEVGVFLSGRVPEEWRLHLWSRLQLRAASDNAPARLHWRCLAEMARAHAAVRQWREAEQVWRCLIEMQRQSECPSALAESLVELLGLLEKVGRISEALELFSELREQSEKAGDLWCRMVAAKTQGRFLTRSDRKESFQKALANFREAEACARLIGDVFEVISAIGQQGNVFFRLEEYEEALNRHLEETRLAEQAGDPILIQAALGSQAAVALVRADFAKIEDLLARRKQLAEETGDPLARMQTTMQYAQVDLRWAESRRDPGRRENEERLAAGKCLDILRLAQAHGLENSEVADWARRTRARLGYSPG